MKSDEYHVIRSARLESPDIVTYGLTIRDSEPRILPLSHWRPFSSRALTLEGRHKNEELLLTYDSFIGFNVTNIFLRVKSNAS